jgi:hypothetical protein
MRAVWSFWTRPFRAHHHRFWMSDRHHLLSWVLSVQTARRHLESTSLVTDDEGARMLVDGIGLKFDHVSTSLNVLDREDPDWWCLGKLYAYRSQAEPFVHVDSDCFLWKPLPARMIQADLLAQNPETFVYGGSTYYRPDIVGPVIDSTNGWMPDALRWYIARRGNAAINCGVLGGNDLDFIRRYADLGIRLVQDPANQLGWRSLTDKRYFENVFVEQYLLGACVEFAGAALGRAPNAQYLFDSMGDAFNDERAERAGFTHLIGSAKSDRLIAQRLAARVRRDYPDYYERCARYVGEPEDADAGQYVGALTRPAVLQEV